MLIVTEFIFRMVVWRQSEFKWCQPKPHGMLVAHFSKIPQIQFLWSQHNFCKYNTLILENGDSTSKDLLITKIKCAKLGSSSLWLEDSLPKWPSIIDSHGNHRWPGSTSRCCSSASLWASEVALSAGERRLPLPVHQVNRISGHHAYNIFIIFIIFISARDVFK